MAGAGTGSHGLLAKSCFMSEKWMSHLSFQIYMWAWRHSQLLMSSLLFLLTSFILPFCHFSPRCPPLRWLSVSYLEDIPGEVSPGQAVKDLRSIPDGPEESRLWCPSHLSATLPLPWTYGNYLTIIQLSIQKFIWSSNLPFQAPSKKKRWLLLFLKSNVK
jgi:hypothetical protein